MPALHARPVRLTASVRNRLKTIARGHKSPHRDRLRAQIVLDAARRRSNARIARDRHINEDTVRKWRGRFAERGLAGLVDLDRSGRPSRFTPVQVAEIKALACQLPAESDTPLARWSHAELAREARARGIIDLYQGRWQGRRLGKDEYVISSDEKPSIQARCRCHPTLAPGKRRVMRVEHEYDRGGVLTYLAAYDVHQAVLHGRCAPTSGIAPFMALVEQVMSQQPYKSAKRVFWIVDNAATTVRSWSFLVWTLLVMAGYAALLGWLAVRFFRWE